MDGNLVEVFRIIPEKDKYYYTTKFTKKIGSYPYERYFANSNSIRYVGKFVRLERGGYGDGGWTTAFFELNGHIEEVNFDYEGTTSFIEILSST